MFCISTWTQEIQVFLKASNYWKSIIVDDITFRPMD
jgi:hypothetical protein